MSRTDIQTLPAASLPSGARKLPALVAGMTPPMHRRGRLGAAIALTACVFWVDSITQTPGAVSVLYAGVILLVGDLVARRWLIAIGLFVAALAVAGFLPDHARRPLDASLLRLIAGLVAIFITTALMLRNRSAQSELVEHAELLELTHDTVVIRAITGDIRYWNHGAERLYGYPRTTAVGSKCFELLKTQLPAPEDEILDHLRSSGKWSGELTRIRSNGEPIVLESNWSLRQDGRTGALEIVEISNDITEQRKASRAAQAAEQRYEHIFETAGVAIWQEDWSKLFERLEELREEHGPDLTDFLGERRDVLRSLISQVRVIDANEAAIRMFEASCKKDLIGHVLPILFTATTECSFRGSLVGLAGDGARFDDETEFETFKGNTVSVLLRGSVSSENLPWDRVLISALDVTERKRTEQKMAQMAGELAHAARVATLGELTASIAHEVNQPLSAVSTYAQSAMRWLSREAEDPKETRECLERIVHNSRRAVDVVNRVRAMSKKTAASRESLSLCDILAESMDLVRREFGGSHVELIHRFEPDLPQVMGDRVQIQQVVMNLLLNALQSLSAVDRPEKAVWLEAIPRSDGTLSVFVRDNGIGIAGDPAGIFTPFFTTKETGMGMGLSICRSIIEAHGGQMHASNNPNGGASVGFQLPAAYAAMETMQ